MWALLSRVPSDYFCELADGMIALYSTSTFSRYYEASLTDRHFFQTANYRNKTLHLLLHRQDGILDLEVVISPILD